MNGFEAKPLLWNGSVGSHHSHGALPLAAPLNENKAVKPLLLDAAAVVGIWLTTDTAVINVRKDATENLRELLLGNVV